MVAPINSQYQVSEPTAAEVELARAANDALTQRLMEESAESISMRLEGGPDEAIEIPATALQLLKRALAEMAQGNALAVMPIETELTTQQAADLLHVSRPFLIDLLEKGTIPHHKVGSHRRVMYKDVMDYKRDIDTKRLAVLEELVAQAQELDMGY